MKIKDSIMSALLATVIMKSQEHGSFKPQCNVGTGANAATLAVAMHRRYG